MMRYPEINHSLSVYRMNCIKMTGPDTDLLLLDSHLWYGKLQGLKSKSRHLNLKIRKIMPEAVML